MGRKLFCELNPWCYKLSEKKEVLIRNIKDLLKNEKIAKEKIEKELPNIIKSHTSIIVRRLQDVDIVLQENKKTNIQIACSKINGLIIHPGEVFSFWKTLGPTRKKDGYKEGLMIYGRRGLGKGIGGGLCQMANMVHLLVLHSGLTVTELHHHSDALFPDERRRVPFGTGTSVSYNKLDYRFKNTTDQDVQLLTWIENGEVCGELRSEREFPYRYKLVEENHHFKKEGDKYYRISKVYRIIIDRKTNQQIRKELILDNHSEVLYDYNLIPKEEIVNV